MNRSSYLLGSIKLEPQANIVTLLFMIKFCVIRCRNKNCKIIFTQNLPIQRTKLCFVWLHVLYRSTNSTLAAVKRTTVILLRTFTRQFTVAKNILSICISYGVIDWLFAEAVKNFIIHKCCHSGHCNHDHLVCGVRLRTNTLVDIAPIAITLITESYVSVGCSHEFWD